MTNGNRDKTTTTAAKGSDDRQTAAPTRMFVCRNCALCRTRCERPPPIFAFAKRRARFFANVNDQSTNGSSVQFSPVGNREQKKNEQ